MATDTDAPAGARKRTLPRPDQTDEYNSLAHYPPQKNLLLREPVHEMHYSSSNTTSLTSYLDQVCQKNKEHEKNSAIQESRMEAVGGKDPNTSDPFDETAVIPDVEEGDDDPDIPTVTVRSCLVGLIMAIFGAAVSQVSCQTLDYPRKA
jgi:hypothetical protein